MQTSIYLLPTLSSLLLFSLSLIQARDNDLATEMKKNIYEKKKKEKRNGGNATKLTCPYAFAVCLASRQGIRSAGCSGKFTKVESRACTNKPHM